MTYSTYATVYFKELYDDLNTQEKDWIKSVKNNLKNNISGDILRYSWFREKKYLNKRLYFIIDEREKKILFVGYGSKKEQQKIIDFVLDNKIKLFSALENATDQI